jgi:hypothetical protein
MGRKWWVLKCAKFAVLAVIVVAVVGAVVMSLWNWLMPVLFGWRTIDFWQAVGLFILSKLLLGGFRGGAGRHFSWRRRMQERWANMSEEEREKFRAGMRQCWDRHHHDDKR